MCPHVYSADGQLDAASWCRHLVPDGSAYAFLADHRHRLFPPELFADLLVQGRSHPSVPTEVVATVLVLQALEGLSDREAISALRRDIAWKVACGLRLDDEGFHPTVLGYWRARLRASEQPRRILEAVRQVVEATGRPTREAELLEDWVVWASTVRSVTNGPAARARLDMPSAIRPRDIDRAPGRQARRQGLMMVEQVLTEVEQVLTEWEAAYQVSRV